MQLCVLSVIEFNNNNNKKSLSDGSPPTRFEKNNVCDVNVDVNVTYLSRRGQGLLLLLLQLFLEELDLVLL